MFDGKICARGEVYYADIDSDNPVGGEQKGRRPIVILQNNIGNRYSGTVIAAICTTNTMRKLPTHVIIYDTNVFRQPSAVCLEQIKTLDKSRLIKFIGKIGQSDMARIEKAVMRSLGMEEYNMENDVRLDKTTELVKMDTAFDGQKTDWGEIARNQMIFFSQIGQYITNLTIQKEEKNKDVENILSYIEYTQFNAADGYKVYKLLRDRLKKVSALDREIRQLEAMTANIDCDQMYTMFQIALGRMQVIDSQAEERKKLLSLGEFMKQEIL